MWYYTTGIPFLFDDIDLLFRSLGFLLIGSGSTCGKTQELPLSTVKWREVIQSSSQVYQCQHYHRKQH